MPVELYRIDDRLIHGQVVVGWGQPLNIVMYQSGQALLVLSLASSV